jgi:hypothetical protein
LLELIKLPNIKPKWRELAISVVCPYCGDDRGHCGITSDGTRFFCVKCHNGGPTSSRAAYQTQRNIQTSLDPAALNAVDAFLHTVLASCRVDREETLSYLVEKRGMPKELAERLIEKGFVVPTRHHMNFSCSVEDQKLLRKHPALKAASSTQISIDIHKNALLVPIYQPGKGEDSAIVDIRTRSLMNNTRSKYLWVAKKSKGSAKYPRPKYTFVEGNDHTQLLIIEGEIKAEVASYYLGCDSVGLIGASNYSKVGDIFTELYDRGRSHFRVLLAPDLDTYKKNKDIALKVVEAALALAPRELEISFLLWHPMGSREKGLDDFLLAHTENMPIECSFRDFWESLAPATREYIESKVQDNALFPSLFNPPAVLTLEMDKPFCSQMAAYFIDPITVSSDEEAVDALIGLLFDKCYSKKIMMPCAVQISSNQNGGAI